MYKDELDAFFEFAFEQFLNEKLFFRGYSIDKQKMCQYTDSLVSIPLEVYVQYLSDHVFPVFPKPSDVVQFSSIADATINFCVKVEKSGDEGLRFVDLGRLLLDDGKERKAGALTKYGENHGKTALEFGLAQNVCDYIYLSCIGKVFAYYSQEKQKELLKRTILRNRFIQRLVILSQKKIVSLDEEMSFLAETTIKRRCPNIRTIFSLYDNDELQLFNNIKGLNIYPKIELPVAMAAEPPSGAPLAKNPNIIKDKCKQPSKLSTHPEQEVLDSRFLMKKEVFKTLFYEGFAIDKKDQPKILAAGATPLKQGEQRKVILLIKNELCPATLYYQASGTNILQILYSSRSAAASLMKELFPNSYEYLMDGIKTGNPQKKRLPKDAKEYFAVYATDVSDVFEIRILNGEAD